MAIKINTFQQKEGGGGLGKLLGTLAGGVGGFFLGGPAGAMAGSALGGSLGGAAGDQIKPGEQKDLGVPIEGAKDTGIGAPKQQGPSAIDRLNQITDIGTSVYGGVDALSGGAGPKVTNYGSDPMNPYVSQQPRYDAIHRRMGR